MVIIKSLYLLKILNQQTYQLIKAIIIINSKFMQKAEYKNKKSRENHQKTVQLCKNGYYSKVKTSHVTNQNCAFVDNQYGHVSESISEHGYSKPYLWIPAQQLHHNPTFSSQLKNIQQIKFSKLSINHALMILNWFVPNVFDQIINRQINYNHFYYFDILKNGVIQQLKIDSYVPVDAVQNEQLFAKNYLGSIFPCLYQKLLAKIYNDYESIPKDFIEIVQTQSLFCRQQISTSKIKNAEDIQKLKNKISKKSHEKHIIFFKTRNSTRLSSFGLQPNSCYLLTRIIQLQQEKYGIIEFLQMGGSKWIGKYSKLRSTWHFQQQVIEESQLNLMSQVKQNYMSFQDMKRISRQIIILNNTQNFHKTWIQSEPVSNYSTTSIRSQQDILNYYTFSSKQNNQIMIKLSTKVSCRICLIFIKVIDDQFSYTNKNQKIYKSQGERYLQSKQNFPKTYKIIDMSFKQNKSSNYLNVQCAQGRYIIAVIIQKDKNESASHVLTLFSSKEKINIKNLTVQQYRAQGQLTDPFQVELNFKILKQTFMKLIQSQQKLLPQLQQGQIKQKIIIKQMYQSCGLGFILAKVPKLADYILKIQFDVQKMKSNNIYPLKQLRFPRQIKQGQTQIYIFKLYWGCNQKSHNQNLLHSFQPIQLMQKQKIIFPPLDSIKMHKNYQK